MQDSPKPSSRHLWIASYPRSGCTWIQIYLFNLVNIINGRRSEQNINLLPFFSPSDSNRVHYRKHLKWSDQNSLAKVAAVRRLVVEDIATDASEFIEETKGVTFIKTNWLLGKVAGFDTIDFSSAGGAVYVVRNPLDVTVSLASHMGQPIEAAIDFMCTPHAWVGGESATFMSGSWSENVNSWTRHFDPKILTLRYEDLLDNPSLWFAALNRMVFRGARLPPDQVDLAIQHASFEAVKAQEEKFGFYAKPDRTTLFFRKGRSNQWKEVLTKNQVDRIIEAHREAMERFGYLTDQHMSLSS
jgi:hypothetical protein